MYSSGFLSNRRLAVSLICLRMSTKIDVLLRISINRINLISTHLIKAMSSNLPGSVALMNKLRSDPFSFLDRFNDSASDPVFQMRLMRAFAEKQINPLDVIDASNLSTDSNLRLCVGAYEELKHMEKALSSYPEKLTQLEEISQRNRLFKVADELFPVGGNCIRGSDYVDHCLDQNQQFTTTLTFHHGFDRVQPDKKGVFFILTSQLYLSQLWPLLLFNSSVYQESFLVHIHVINPDTSFLCKISTSDPNIIISSSEVDAQRPHMTPYYHAHRYLILPTILAVHKLPIILLGADVVFRDKADILVESMPHCVGLYRGQNPEPFKTPWNHACGDLVCVPYTEDGALFAKGVSNYINGVDTIKQHTLYLDQAALAMVFNRMYFYKGKESFFDPKIEIKKVCNLNSRGSLSAKLENALSWHDSVTGTTMASDFVATLNANHNQ